MATAAVLPPPVSASGGFAAGDHHTAGNTSQALLLSPSSSAAPSSPRKSPISFSVGSSYQWKVGSAAYYEHFLKQLFADQQSNIVSKSLRLPPISKLPLDLYPLLASYTAHPLLYILGGDFNECAVGITSVEVCDLQTLQWHRVSAIKHQGRIHAAAAVINLQHDTTTDHPPQRHSHASQILLTGGTFQHQLLSTTQIYDPAHRLWSTVDALQLQIARSGHSVHVVCNGSILAVIGGIVDVQTELTTTSCEFLRLHTSHLPKLLLLPALKLSISRAHHTSVYDSQAGIVYVFGGWSSQHGALSSCEALCLRTGRSLPIASMKFARVYAAACLYNNKVYVLGGASHIRKHRVYSSVEVYDIATAQWSLTSSMLYRRCGHSVTAYNNKLYVVGGYNNIALNNVNEIYNIGNGCFSLWNPADSKQTVLDDRHVRGRAVPMQAISNAANARAGADKFSSGNGMLQIQRAFHASCA